MDLGDWATPNGADSGSCLLVKHKFMVMCSAREMLHCPIPLTPTASYYKKKIPLLVLFPVMLVRS